MTFQTVFSKHIRKTLLRVCYHHAHPQLSTLTMSEALAEALTEKLGHAYPFPIYTEKLKPPRPFLVPSLGDKPVEILPSEKPSRKIRFEESILVKEIANRFNNDEYPEDDEEGSYEIEIVEEDDGEADFYVEIVDGEVFYVFETEDDISEEEYESEDDETSYTESASGPLHPAQFSIPGVPNLEDSFADYGDQIPTVVDSITNQERELLNASTLTMGESFAFLDMDTDFDISDGEAAPAFAHEGVERADHLPKTPVRRASEQIDEDLHLEEMEMDKVASVQNDEEYSLDLSADGSTGDEKKSVGEVMSPTKSEPQSPPAPSSQSPGNSITPSLKSTGQDTVTSILKSSFKSSLGSLDNSPKVPDSPRKKKVKGAPKTFTKTYVRADQYEVDRVYGWEKPQWVDKKLKSTGAGEKIREGGNLAAPITFPEKKTWNDDPNVLKEEGCEKVNMEELMRRLKGGDSAGPSPMLKRHRGKLKVSIYGAKIREGGDIVQPITQATVFKKRDDVNLEANPTKLRATPVGQLARQGENLAGPITQATTRQQSDVNPEANKDVLKNRMPVSRSKSYEWEKPEWTSGQLRATKRGKLVKKGVDVAQPITQGVRKKDKHPLLRQQSEDSLVEKKKYEWEKPAWTQIKLGSTGKGDGIKNGKRLERPITFPLGKGPAQQEGDAEPDVAAERRTFNRSLSSDL